MKILTSAQMRHVEALCAGDGLSSSVLMENAGRAAAGAIRTTAGDVPRECLVLVGPGNNGGDGLVAGRYLHGMGTALRLYLLSGRRPDDSNLAFARECGIPVSSADDDPDLSQLRQWLASADVVVDAVFGIGRSRPLCGVFASALKCVSEARRRRSQMRVFALDLPSGLDADSGSLDPMCPGADETISFGFPKPGMFSHPGAEVVGRIRVVDIGIPSHLVKDGVAEFLTPDWVTPRLPLRPLVANKGTFGKVMVAGGSAHYVGAPCLACNAAMRVGAGLVTLAAAASLHPIVATALTETTHLPLPESGAGVFAPRAASVVRGSLSSYEVLLAGCGLGQSPATVRFLKSLLFPAGDARLRLVIDADGLNILSTMARWWRRLPGDAILTPHPGEMARLTGKTVDDVQSDRLGVARNAAVEWQKTVVLKGAYTVIAAPDGRVAVSPFANPGMASAGTGDVLAGTVAGLAAQGIPLFDAAACAVYIHGQAGELVLARLGDAGMVASDLLPALPMAMKSVKLG